MWATTATLSLALQAAVFLLSTSVSATLDPIVIEGSHFFYKTNGSEFYIRGVAYQQDVDTSGSTNGSTDYVDPLADAAGCQRDIPILQELSTNVIHVYAINASLDHSACMSLLDAAGIYVLVDLSNPSSAFDRDSPTWNLDLYTTYTSVVDSMATYTNVLGFFAGNEVSNNSTNSDAAAYVKAAVRDIKSYIAARGYRAIGVGYATNDDASILRSLQDYLNCGDSDSSIDFLGMNIYSWCGDSSFTQSGYSELTTGLSNYSIPTFFSEFGCNTVQPRTFTEVEALYSSQMTDVFSGGIVFEYFQETNDFGLVSVSGNTVSKITPDFNAYSTQIASISPSSTASSAYTPTNTVARSCPATGSAWFASETLPPTPNSVLCDCMMASLNCVAKTSTLQVGDTISVFSEICTEDPSACTGITSNATTGTYGAYSMCNVSQQASWVLTRWNIAQGNASGVCTSQNFGEVQTPASLSTECQSALAQVGTTGTGTGSSLPSGTGTVGTSSSATGRSGSGSSGSSGSGSGGGGLSTGAKAGVAIAAVLIVAILAGLVFILWHRKRRTSNSKRRPVSGPPEGGLEVGDAPPEFTALKKTELEANEAKDYIITGEPTDAAIATHDIHVDGNGVNELDSNRERQELDSTGAPLQLRRSELDGTARQSEMSGIASRGELSGNSTSRSELSPRRKPISSSALPIPPQSQQNQPISSSWTNNPWTDPGVGGLAATPASGRLDQSVANPAAVPNNGGYGEDAAEMRRLEEEERRIDEAIAESERLQALRKEKEELQRRRVEMMARSSGGGGGGGGSSG